MSSFFANGLSSVGIEIPLPQRRPGIESPKSPKRLITKRRRKSSCVYLVLVDWAAQSAGIVWVSHAYTCTELKSLVDDNVAANNWMF